MSTWADVSHRLGAFLTLLALSATSVVLGVATSPPALAANGDIPTVAGTGVFGV